MGDSDVKKTALSKADTHIHNRILTIRGIQAMIDRDLAELYGVETKRLNEQVKRNIDRFPERYCFQLTESEKNEVVANCDHLASLKFSYQLPYAFTEQGVAMLSAVLRSETAVKVSLQIIDSFVAMRRFIYENAAIFQRLDKLEYHQHETSEKFERLFKALENKNTELEKGIFYEGQVFDAYTFMADLVRKAKSSILLIDNYVDDTVLRLFAKREKNVSVTIYTKRISKQLELDLEKYNTQYTPISIKQFNASHDRFLILDNATIYHIGASLKDLGKKWFAFSKMDSEAIGILSKLKDE